jgi:hypothetical protein
MIGDALDVFEKFIKVAKELSQLPQLATPQYGACAKDLYLISQSLFTANEKLASWLNRFSYFDFGGSTAKSDFLRAVQEYRTMKMGPELQQLRFHCHDIESIYYRNVRSGIRDWFAREDKRAEVQSVFEELSRHDTEMVDFVMNELLSSLDATVTRLEPAVDNPNPDLLAAERIRLEYKAGLSTITPRLEWFNAEMAQLVMDFAGLAKVPLTLR